MSLEAIKLDAAFLYRITERYYRENKKKIKRRRECYFEVISRNTRVTFDLKCLLMGFYKKP